LDRGIDGGQQHERLLLLARPRQMRQRRHPPRHHAGIRRHPIIGLAIPGREHDGGDIGRIKRQRLFHRRQPAGIAQHHDQCRLAGLGTFRARDIADDKAFKAIGNRREGDVSGFGEQGFERFQRD